jgi:alpha-L-fucosidase
MYYQNDTTGIPDFGKKIYTHHLKTYGHPSEIGFKDIIPTWKAEKWNPDALVTLFKEAGAKYIVPLAVHHDNFDNFDSSYQEWNSVNMGPKRDIIGDWAKATRKQGLRFGASSHAGRSWRHHKMAHASDTHGKYKDVPYDGVLRKKDGKGKWWEGFDPQELYGIKPGKKPDSLFLKKWYNRTTELYDKFDLDLPYDGLMSNCVHCHLKGKRKNQLIAKQTNQDEVNGTPAALSWWVDIEKKYSRKVIKSTKNNYTNIGFFGASDKFVYQSWSDELQDENLISVENQGADDYILPCNCTD